MNYNRKRIDSKNAYTHTYTNGSQVLYSYATPVAVYIPGLGFLKTSRKWSVTTTRHVNGWLKTNNYPIAQSVEQNEIYEWETTLNKA